MGFVYQVITFNNCSLVIKQKTRKSCMAIPTFILRIKQAYTHKYFNDGFKDPNDVLINCITFTF